MTPFKIEGVLLEVQDPIQVGKTTKTEFILGKDLDSNYPNHIKFELWGEKGSEVDKAELNSVVEVAFYVGGRKWDGKDGTKYFNSLKAVGVQMIGGTADIQPQAETEDDLPF